MNTSPYEYVSAVARHGTFTKAAASIPISQQGLSKAVERLESDLGVRLFEREGKRVSLTEAARELLPYIDDLLAAQSKLTAKAAQLRIQPSAPASAVSLYTSAFFTVGMLGDLDQALAARSFPRATVLELDLAETVERVAAEPGTGIGIANVPVSMMAQLPADGSVVFDALFSSELVVMASRKLLPPRKHMLGARHMRKLPLSYPNYPIINEMAAELIGHYRPENIVLHTSNVARIDRSVLAGESAAITDSVTAYLNRNRSDCSYFALDYAIRSNIGFLHAPIPEGGAGTLESYLAAIRDYIVRIMGPYARDHPPVGI